MENQEELLQMKVQLGKARESVAGLEKELVSKDMELRALKQ